MEFKKSFSTHVKRIYNDYLVCVITHDTDDFGNKRQVENFITIDRAKEILENLKQTIEEYERTNL